MEESAKQTVLSKLKSSSLIRLLISLAIVFTTCANSSARGYIGEDKAMSIALKHAELVQDAITVKKIHLDTDDRPVVYDIEFYTKDAEYDYEIDAVKGTILEFSRNLHDSVRRGLNSGSAQRHDIGKDGAKNIALEHAKLTRSDVWFLRAEREHDDGRITYEVKFRHDGIKYKYEIDAATGTIFENSGDRK